MIVGFVAEHRDEFGVEPICTMWQVAPSTNYAVKRRELAPSARAVRDIVMMQVLMVLWVVNRKVYGAPSRGRREGDPFGGPVTMRLGVGGLWSAVGRTRLGCCRRGRSGGRLVF